MGESRSRSTTPIDFWIDRGGTFTDILAYQPDTPIKALKLLSNSDLYIDAASEGIKRILGLKADSPIPKGAINSVKMGTTVATNALLELEGAKTLFIVTEGFDDILTISDQSRPNIFALKIDRTPPLQFQTLEVEERIDKDGRILKAINEKEIEEKLVHFYNIGIESIAIAFINSYINNRHEKRVEAIARSIGFNHVTLSSDVSSLVKFVPRASTAVIDAYLEPVLRHYVERVQSRLDQTPLYFMQSSGGLCDTDNFRARNAVLSGPAGGVVGMAMTARASGYDKVIGFDMGGTSTDVSRFDGEDYTRQNEASFEGRKLRAPMLSIHTVAAGGGSILHFDGERARVGPKSAGAKPGPACYGLDGPAALTDANLVLGRIQKDWFPKVFGPQHISPLDQKIATKKLENLANEMGLDSPQAAAEGFLTVAIEAMAGAIKAVSTREGIDPRQYALNAFGGAGGQHACKVAEVLGIKTVLIHPQSGLLSAYGIGLAPIIASEDANLDKPLDKKNWHHATTILSELERQVHEQLSVQNASDIKYTHEIRIRTDGSDTSINLIFGSEDDIRAQFDQAHKRLFGFIESDANLIIESVNVRGEGVPTNQVNCTPTLQSHDIQSDPAGHTKLYVKGRWLKANIYLFEHVSSGLDIQGPALIMEHNQTIIVDPGWTAHKDHTGMLIVENKTSHRIQVKSSTHCDPITLELFNRRFMSIAEHMGVVLERTAHSVNMKERLDFSCAVFDANGGLVANAPHMPVHLGSMAASVKAALSAHQDLGPDDAIALNAPYNGGTHLPDITVIQPVCKQDGERIFFVATRGHHADIGGISPGSMPPFSKTIYEEGVIFDCIKLLDKGQFNEEGVRKILSSGPYPARNPNQNISDLKAQLAACAKGAHDLKTLVKSEGLAIVKAYMGYIQNNSEAAVRRLISVLQDGEAVAELEDGARICVSIRVNRKAQTARIDFTGTSKQLESNFNAPSAVTRAAVLYVLRCLVNDDIPLNEGCLNPIELIIPEGCLLSPKHPAAVVAGNVETSQLVVDALFAATGHMANSQGTMNNLTFGSNHFQYYETLCGGSGAGQDKNNHGFCGTSAVHTHMTNSKLTDPEILEQRYPVRVLTHKVRPNSGGVAQFKGGNGLLRRIEFLDTMTVALLSGRRKIKPKGLNSYSTAKTGAQHINSPDKGITELPSNFEIEVSPGTVLTIQTPGGGGFNSPSIGKKQN